MQNHFSIVCVAYTVMELHGSYGELWRIAILHIIFKKDVIKGMWASAFPLT